MTEQKTFILDRRTVAKHRAGQVLAIESSAIGRSFAVVSGPRKINYRHVANRRAVNSAVSSGPKRPRSVIAEVDVFGPLTQRSESYCGYIDGYDNISARIVEELGKVEVGAVLVRIDSPGGDAAGIEEAISRIASARGASGKPIAVYVDEMAASAGYWLASGIASAGVYAPRSGRVGSVGCWSMIVDERGALEQEGIAITVVRDPAGKDAANPYSPVAELALVRESQVVVDIATRFYSAVASTRGLTPERVRAFDAAMFSAEEAKALNLIDGIASYEDAIVVLARKASEAANNRTAASAKKTQRIDVTRVESRSRHMSNRQKVADAQPNPDKQKTDGGRATAADVSQSCNDTSQACLDCASACDSGTADEAIAATQSCISSCEACIKTCKSFLGSADMPGDSPAPEPATDPQAPQNASDARVIALLESIEAERAQERSAKKAQEQADERRTLIASRRITNKETRAWLEDPRTSIQSVRDACRVLPPSEVPNLAGDLTASPTRASGSTGLDERELKICKDTGCAPEKFAALKAQREAYKASRS